MNKLFKSIALVVPLLVSFSVLSTQEVSAEEYEEAPVLNINSYYSPETVYSIEQSNGNIITFDTEEDYSAYLENQGEENLITPYGSTTTKNVLLSSKKYNMQWIGYHSYTKDWAKASSYTLGSGKTYSASGSLTYDGMTVSLGYSKTQSGSTTFKANSSKFSKLGVWADLTVKKYKTTSYDNITGKALSSWNTSTVSYQNFYTQVKYK